MNERRERSKHVILFIKIATLCGDLLRVICAVVCRKRRKEGSGWYGKSIILFAAKTMGQRKL